MTSALSSPTITLTPEAFEARFSDLIELVCDAAQAGRAEPLLEAQYALLRAWMNEHFPPLLTQLPPDSVPDFHALYHPETLAAILEADQGELMGYLLRTQHAITRWKNAQRSVVFK